MADTQADLDTALTNVGNLVTQLVAEVTALIAKVSAVPGSPDFTTEVTALNSIAASLQSSIDSAKAVTGS